MSLLKSISLNIGEKLLDKEYRNVFFEEWAKDEVADQIRQLRKFRRLRQIDVANETGMKQSAISRIEQSEYSRWNFATLLRIAQALDARVRVVFEPAEEVINRYEFVHKKVGNSASVIAARRAAAAQEPVIDHLGQIKNQGVMSVRLLNEQRPAALDLSLRVSRVELRQ